ncbi:MAG TPA: UdgX family uracil-DNA binding protein [Nevskiaceae bacterium]|nr:UdgX family uracil-DNA binding protein [Nevskiaceae bacterium]
MARKPSAGLPSPPPERSARDFFPERKTLATLERAAKRCRGCDLYRNATQTVFGSGPKHARVVLVGEQPGNDEDLAGEPFIGPAGRLLDEALQAAGISRADAYVTNVVKHFKWEPRGKRRLHSKPSAREIAACSPWLGEELAQLKPAVLVCLGATAAQALLGRSFKLLANRGKVLPTTLAEHAVATVHPSSVLRAPDSESRAQARRDLIRDLKVVARLLG